MRRMLSGVAGGELLEAASWAAKHGGREVGDVVGVTFCEEAEGAGVALGDRRR